MRSEKRSFHTLRKPYVALPLPKPFRYHSASFPHGQPACEVMNHDARRTKESL
jgi:hypothetical protein